MVIGAAARRAGQAKEVHQEGVDEEEAKDINRIQVSVLLA
jgi:hypothetical protein